MFSRFTVCVCVCVCVCACVRVYVCACVYVYASLQKPTEMILHARLSSCVRACVRSLGFSWVQHLCSLSPLLTTKPKTNQSLFSFETCCFNIVDAISF